MRTEYLFCLLAGAGQSTIIRNLTHNGNGWLELETSHSVLGIVTSDNIQRSPSPRLFPIYPGSQYSNLVRSVMFVPPSESYPSFRMIESIRDPTPFCFEGTIGLAEMGPSDRAVTFSASVALIPQADGRPLPGMDLNTTSRRRHEFYLNTLDDHDIIPSDVYELFMSHADIPNNDLFPSLEYTIYRSAESSDVVARIVLGPRDYLPSIPTQTLLPYRPHPQIGINTLKYVGVFLNYANRQIGFCEPLEYTHMPPFVW